MISQLAPPRGHFFLPASFAAQLIPTEFIELIKYRTDLPTFFGIWVKFAQLLSQRDKVVIRSFSRTSSAKVAAAG
jgi:hypothetical protein